MVAYDTCEGMADREIPQEAQTSSDSRKGGPN
jgi:hypothetical protein